MKIELFTNNRWNTINSFEEGNQIYIDDENNDLNGKIELNNEKNRVQYFGKNNVWFLNKYGKTEQEGIKIENNNEFYLYLVYSQIEDALEKSKEKGIIDGYSIDIINNDNINFIYHKVFDEGELKNCEDTVNINNAKNETIEIVDIIKEISNKIIN